LQRHWKFSQPLAARVWGRQSASQSGECQSRETVAPVRHQTHTFTAGVFSQRSVREKEDEEQ